VGYRQRMQRQGDIIVSTLAMPSQLCILREFVGFVLGGLMPKCRSVIHFSPPRTYKSMPHNPKTGIAVVVAIVAGQQVLPESEKIDGLAQRVVLPFGWFACPYAGYRWC
jgi:hypothetical protein